MVQKFVCCGVLALLSLLPLAAQADEMDHYLLLMRRQIDHDMFANIISYRTAWKLKQQLVRIQNEQSSLTARDNGIISNNDENYLLRLGHIVALRIEAAEHGHYQ